MVEPKRGRYMDEAPAPAYSVKAKKTALKLNIFCVHPIEFIPIKRERFFVFLAQLSP
jgi:hypothetical protein